MLYRNVVRPLLFRLWSDPEEAHEFAMEALIRAPSVPGALPVLRGLGTVCDSRLKRTLWNLEFENPIGLAGGFDKNARAIPALEALGFGHLEVGTVTAHPQPGNERPRVFRLPEQEALINRFGFNNEGSEALAVRLARAAARRIPVGISLGKSKVTPLDQAVDDYLTSFRRLYPFGDYFAINVSSPNTPGLRSLQGSAELDALLSALGQERDSQRVWKPLLVKVSPDLEWEALEELLDVCRGHDVDGLIATNTTISRTPLGDPPPARAGEAGGLSGRPLFTRALEVVRHIRGRAPDLPLIGVGGILTPDDAYAMLRAGADLLQVYTGLIYRGPFIARELNHGLLRLMSRDGVSSLAALRKAAV